MADTIKLPPSILKLDPTPFRSPVLPFAACRMYSDGTSPHVHFPPTPIMTVTYPADSPNTYDRKPIAVSPNRVQLPRRGARKFYSPPADFDRRGRTSARGHRWSRVGYAEDLDIKGSYFHPRAYEACSPEPTSDRIAKVEDVPSLPPLPPLIQDLSPSDESDDSVTTPPRTMQPTPRSIDIHLPNFGCKTRRSVDGRHCPEEADGSPLPEVASLSVPPTRTFKKVAQQLVGCEKSYSDAFPMRDEGCLGGF